MKTKRILVMALACMAAMSCLKEQKTPGYEARAFSFEMEKEGFAQQNTKAVLVDGKKTEWSAGDEVAVFDGTSSHKFVASSDGVRSPFTTESTTVDTSVPAYIFLYPYSETATADVIEGVVGFNVPTVQTAVNGSFDPQAAVSVATATAAELNGVIKAKNALALLKIAIPADLSGKPIKVIVEAKAGEYLAGDVLCDIATKNNEMQAGGAASAAVSLASAPPMAEGVYYLALRPCTVASGIKVTVMLRDKSYYARESSASFTFEPNHIYDMGTVGTSGWSVTTYQYEVSTVSGTGSSGKVDGGKGVASWSHLGGIQYAPDGNLRILDRGNAMVREMTTDTYEVTTLSSGTPFNAPWHGAFAPDGTFYIANKGAKTVVKVDVDGKNPETVMTGFVDPIDVDFDASGNLYVLDRNANAIYCYDGTASETQTKLADLTGGLAMEFNAEGDIIAYSNKGTLHFITPEGKVSTIAGSGTLGTDNGTPCQPLSAKINNAFDLEVSPDGTVYLVEDPTACVRMLVPDANGSYEYAYLTTIIGTMGSKGYADGVGTAAKLNSPYSICLSPDEKTLWIGDRGNYRIRRVDIKPHTEKCTMSGDHEDFGGTDDIVSIF